MNTGEDRGWSAIDSHIAIGSAIQSPLYADQTEEAADYPKSGFSYWSCHCSNQEADQNNWFPSHWYWDSKGVFSTKLINLYCFLPNYLMKFSRDGTPIYSQKKGQVAADFLDEKMGFLCNLGSFPIKV